MNKIGILTFHYSNNFGGVLQTEALYKTIISLGYDAEVINYVPLSYQPLKKLKDLGKKRIFNEIKAPLKLYKKIKIMNNNSEIITKKFNSYRDSNLKLSKRVNEETLYSLLGDYSKIIVGSDQVWNPSQRNSPIYFLDYKDFYSGKKISYAADSTIPEVTNSEKQKLKSILRDYDNISVRNEHSQKFVNAIINKLPPVVCDPTLLYDFKPIKSESLENKIEDDYILIYILGEEINGSYHEAIKRIKKKFPGYKIYSIKNPTVNFELDLEADKVFYDLDPSEWVKLIINASFMFTDSFHGVLFSIKYRVPFLSYYTEKLRANRFIDLSKRYMIDKFIVQSVSDIDRKRSLELEPNFKEIQKIIKKQTEESIDFLKNALKQ